MIMTLRGAAIGLWGATLLLGCGARDEVELVHPSTDAAARAVMAVDYFVQLTDPDNFVLRPDEFGGVTVDAKRGLLYAGGRGGFLSALSAEDGAVAWEIEMAGAVSGLPVIVEDPEDPLLLVGTDNGMLHAIGLRDHQTRWSYATPGRLRNPPLVFEGVVFVVNSRDQIYALDLRTGTWRWQYEQELQTDFTVHGHAGLSFVPAAEQGTELGTMLACFDNGKAVALAAGSGQALWIASVAPPEGGDFIDCDTTPLVDPEAGLVYVAGESTGVFALSLETGDEQWRYPMRGVGALAFGPDGALVGSSSLEGLFVLEPDGSRLRWRARTDPGVLSAPLVVDDVVFVTHSEIGMLAFDLQTGELAAQLRTGSGMSSVPTHDPTRQRLFGISNRGVLVVLRTGDAIATPWTDAAPGA